MTYLREFSTKETPQSEQIPGTVPNSAGGYAFPVDDWARLHRFFILGTEGGTYYINQKSLTRENAQAVERCIREDGSRVVREIVAVSDEGRAAKNDPALFALAMCCKLGDEATRRAAYLALPKVARIGTHLFHFAAYVELFGGWGQGLKRAVQRWYDRPDLALQAVKYQSRDGWSHRDLLRLAHPKTTDPIVRWIVKGGPTEHPLIDAAERIKTADKKMAAAIIREARLPREAVPTELLTKLEVWEALFEDMPLTAMIRNLATMTRVGLIAPMSDAALEVGARLTAERIRKARVHPIAILAAMLTYASGRGQRGQNTWRPVREVVDALDAAFYLAFGNVESTGKRLLLALDVSGSMASGEVGGVPGLTPRVASAAMALVTANVESRYHFVGFSRELIDLDISPRQRLDDVLRLCDGIPFGGTNCSLPMAEALRRKMGVDGFVIYTDSETWAGNIHPSQALARYRRKAGIPAKSIVVGMVSNGFSIADPNDAGMLDVVGFDTATSDLISEFLR